MAARSRRVEPVGPRRIPEAAAARCRAARRAGGRSPAFSFLPARSVYDGGVDAGGEPHVRGQAANSRQSPARAWGGHRAGCPNPAPRPRVSWDLEHRSESWNGLCWAEPARVRSRPGKDLRSGMTGTPHYCLAAFHELERRARSPARGIVLVSLHGDRERYALPRFRATRGGPFP